MRHLSALREHSATGYSLILDFLIWQAQLELKESFMAKMFLIIFIINSEFHKDILLFTIWSETWWSTAWQVLLAIRFVDSLSHSTTKKTKKTKKQKRSPQTYPVTLGKLVDKEHLTPRETGKRGEEPHVSYTGSLDFLRECNIVGLCLL